MEPIIPSESSLIHQVSGTTLLLILATVLIKMRVGKSAKKKKVEEPPFWELQGYILENHEVQTEDGYILTVHRLLKKKEVSGESNQENETDKRKKPVAVFAHGMFARGDHWCINSPETGLPYKLLEQGYDCWLGDFRGSKNSRKHVSLSPESNEYWNYTFHEMGIYDLPAIIDKILDITGNTSLSYIGHSMGTSIFFAMGSCKPQYCSKIDVMIALAPSAGGKYLRNRVAGGVFGLSDKLSRNKLFHHWRIGTTTSYDYAKYLTLPPFRSHLAAFATENFGQLIGAFRRNGIDKSLLHALVKDMPSPIPFRLLLHGSQIYMTQGEPREFDWGRSKNLEIYGSEEPPLYQFHRVQTPVYLFSSEADELCRPANIEGFGKKLPNVKEHYCLPASDNFSHVDFMLGKNAYRLVYKRVIEILDNYRDKDI